MAHVTAINVTMDGPKLEEVNHNDIQKKISAQPVEPAVVNSTVHQNKKVDNDTRPSMDDLRPADSYSTIQADGAVKLRLSNGDNEKAITVPTMFRQTVQRIPDSIAMGVKRDGRWVTWTYKQYYDGVCQTAKSFIKLGLQPFESVGIMGFNSPEWFMSDLGAIFAGGLATGIYTTNSPEACAYVASNGNASIIVVENNQYLQKFLKVKDQLPNVKAIVQYTGEVAQREPFTYSWDEFMKLSEEVPDSELEDRMKHLAPNQCCTLIYTSGTTGNPKGVMLSHDNMTWTAAKADAAVPIRFGQEVIVSYLPLSHSAAQMLDLYFPIKCGAAVYFAQPDALKGSLAGTLKEIRPTAFLGVPRVWEKMMEKMQAIGRQVRGIKKTIATWGKSIGLRGNYSQMNGNGLPFGWKIAKRLVFDKVRLNLGLDRCRFFLSGAAPITKETLDYFLSLNIPIQEAYGMTESSGPHCVVRPDKLKTMSVGHELPGAEVKLDNPDEDGNGEICMWGRNVFMGYLGEEEKTKETVKEDHWLHSGDIGKKDKQGFLFVTGRIKELIITAGGENIAPIPIEDAVKECLPVVSQCMLIGDKRKFLSMLITLKSDVDADTLEPTDILTTPAVEWCQSVGSDSKTVREVLNKPDVAILKAIQQGIDKANERAVSRAAKVQKWSILPRDFSVPGGELGPTMKLRRPIVSKMYHKTIEAFYEE